MSPAYPSGVARRLAMLLAVVVAANAAWLSGHAAAAPDDLSQDPLQRAALLALPSAYLVKSEIAIEGLRTRDGRRVSLPEGAGRLVELGTAFAIGEGGVLVTAAHVAAPSRKEMARDAYLRAEALSGREHSLAAAIEWVDRTGARPVGVGPQTLTVTPARLPGDGAEVAPYEGRLVAAERDQDLALLDIAAPGAPALELDDGRSRGTPIVVIGFGGQDGATPRVEEGRIGHTGTLKDQPERYLTEVNAAILHGDSGGPVVDAQGAARGIVLSRFEGGGWMAPAAEIRRFAVAADVDLGEGPTAASFRSAMRDLWALDLDRARAGLDETLDRFPRHSLAAREVRQTDLLTVAEYRLEPTSRRRSFLLALGVVAAVGAIACALRLGLLATDGRGA